MIRQFRLDDDQQPGGKMVGKGHVAHQPALRTAHS